MLLGLTAVSDPTPRSFRYVSIWLAVLIAVIAGPTPSRAQDSGDAVRSINEILDAMKSPPGEKPEPAPVAAAANCDELLRDLVSGKRTAGDKERGAVRDCTANAPKIDFAIQFEFDSAKILPAAIPQLNEIGRALETPALKDASFVVAGHTDRKGKRKYNQTLSEARAASVKTYLMENFAVRGKQLTAIGYGFDALKNPAQPLSEVNRRVELIRTN